MHDTFATHNLTYAYTYTYQIHSRACLHLQMFSNCVQNIAALQLYARKLAMICLRKMYIHTYLDTYTYTYTFTQQDFVYTINRQTKQQKVAYNNCNCHHSQHLQTQSFTYMTTLTHMYRTITTTYTQSNIFLCCLVPSKT